MPDNHDNQPPAREAELRAKLRQADTIVPETLRGVFEQDGDAPAYFIESAEGVTTFSGFVHRGHDSLTRQWVEKELADIAEEHPIDPAPDALSRESS